MYNAGLKKNKKKRIREGETCTNKNNLHGQAEMSIIALGSKSLSVIKLVRLFNLNFLFARLVPFSAVVMVPRKYSLSRVSSGRKKKKHDAKCASF